MGFRTVLYSYIIDHFNPDVAEAIPIHRPLCGVSVMEDAAFWSCVLVSFNPLKGITVLYIYAFYTDSLDNSEAPRESMCHALTGLIAGSASYVAAVFNYYKLMCRCSHTIVIKLNSLYAIVSVSWPDLSAVAG